MIKEIINNIRESRSEKYKLVLLKAFYNFINNFAGIFILEDECEAVIIIRILVLNRDLVRNAFIYEEIIR